MVYRVSRPTKIETTEDLRQWTEDEFLQIAAEIEEIEASGQNTTPTSNFTIYVRTDGIDTNTGTEDSAAKAFRTIQKAIDTIAGLNRLNNDYVIHLGAGTFNESLLLRDGVGSRPITITGSGIASTTINNPNGAAALRKDGSGTIWQVGGFKITHSNSPLVGYGISANNGADIRCTGQISYGPHGTSYSHLFASNGARILISQTYTIAGGGRAHMLCWNARIEATIGINKITNSGTPFTFNRFLEVQQLGVIDVQRITFTPTGITSALKYVSTDNSVIRNGGRGDGAIPGTNPFTATGGIIV